MTGVSKVLVEKETHYLGVEITLLSSVIASIEAGADAKSVLGTLKDIEAELAFRLGCLRGLTKEDATD